MKIDKQIPLFTKPKHRPMVFLLYVWIAMLFVTASDLNAQEAEVIDRIVAVVNSDIITLYDLNRALKPFAENIKALGYPPEKERETLFQVRKDLLNQLIDSMLADQKVEQDQISVDEREIDLAIERLKEARSMTDEQLREGLALQGLTIDEYREEMKEQILRSKLVNREVKSKIVVTREDIKSYYESHREKYRGEKKYYLWNVYIKLSADIDISEKVTAQNKMKAIEEKLKQGQSFESVVKELRDSSSDVQGTDLGLFLLAELSKPLRKAVEKMQAGEYSPVLDTDFGYQILYVQKIQETAEKTLEEVEFEIQRKLYEEFVDNKYQEWLDDLRARSHIRIIN